MLVRMFAILLAVGMLCVSAQTPDLVTPDTAAFVDDAPEAPAVALFERPATVAYRPVTDAPSSAPPVLAGHRPETELFRPPRAAAFV